ncbi:MAG TPA: hypothetical protein PLN69_06265 [bacterium]|nr:hypothetical protein [bacterium]
MANFRTVFEKHLEGSRKIGSLLDAGVVPELKPGEFESDSAREVATTYIRIMNLFRSIFTLGEVEHYEAIVTLAGNLFELFIDMNLLTGDETGEMHRRRREFLDIQKFRAAHRMVAFHDESGGRTVLDVEEQRRFKENIGGIEQIRKRIAEVWGPDNSGRSSYPVHWSGRKCTRVISHEMGLEYEELYIEVYSVLSWMISNGMSGEFSEDVKYEICSWCHGVSQLAVLEATKLCAGLSKTVEKLVWLPGAIGTLRRTPGTALTADFFDA